MRSPILSADRTSRPPLPKIRLPQTATDSRVIGQWEGGTAQSMAGEDDERRAPEAAPPESWSSSQARASGLGSLALACRGDAGVAGHERAWHRLPMAPDERASNCSRVVPALGRLGIRSTILPSRWTVREVRFKERVLDFAAIGVGERVLDLGCGTGTLAIRARPASAGRAGGRDRCRPAHDRARAAKGGCRGRAAGASPRALPPIFLTPIGPSTSSFEPAVSPPRSRCQARRR